MHLVEQFLPLDEIMGQPDQSAVRMSSGQYTVRPHLFYQLLSSGEILNKLEQSAIYDNIRF